MTDSNEEMCLEDGSSVEAEKKALEENAAKAPAAPKPAPPPPAPTPAPKPASGKIWRADPTMLYPPFLKKVEAVLAECEAKGIRYYVLSGYRSPEEQNSIYAQGRSDKSKPIVTNAKAWESFHQYHGAVDCCRDADLKKDGLQPDWNLESYRALAEVATKHGLEAAFYWKSFKEGPHIQLPFEKMGLTKDQLKRAYLAGGKKALYALLDKYHW